MHTFLKSGAGAVALSIALFASNSSFAWSNCSFNRTATDFVKAIDIGINIGNTFDVPSGNETDWGNPKVTRDLIHLYKTKGFSVVRLPVSWRKQFDVNDPNHTIAPAFLARVKEVVDWILAEDMAVIVNIHHDGGDDGWPGAWLTIDGVHEDQASAILSDIWHQIALVFRDYDERVVFEGFNEVRKARRYAGPSGRQAGQEDWNGCAEYYAVIARYAKTFYDAVRATGGNNAKRYLMVPTYAAAFSEGAVSAWPNPNKDDNHIIATIHCYEPGDFCLWGNRKAYDAAHVQRRLDEFFPRFKRLITDKGVPLVLGEINADLRFYDEEKFQPNDDARVRWAAHYASEARKYGFPCIIWETGGKRGMGLIDRAKACWVHEEVADAFIGATRGTLTQAKIEEMCAKVKVDPMSVWVKGDALLKWRYDDECYSGAWGQRMGFGNRNGNGVNRDVISSDSQGNLVVDTHGIGGNMVQQQFWADQSVEAIRTWKSYTKTHNDLSLKGRKLVLKLTAAKGTEAMLKGELIIPGVKGRVKFGADSGSERFESKNGIPAYCEVELPEDASLNPNGKGIGAELWFIPGRWGQNLPLNCTLSPIEIK